MICEIQHTAISTPDMERALRFYQGLIGFEVESNFFIKDRSDVDQILGLAGVRTRVVMLRLGHSRLELFEFVNPVAKESNSSRPVCDHGVTHVCLRVTEIQKEYDRLIAGGMQFHCEPKEMGEIVATYGRDPDGNVVRQLLRHQR